MAMDHILLGIGRRCIDGVNRVGGMSILFARVVTSTRHIFQSQSEIFEQLHSIGVRSIPLVIVIAIFVGAVAAWQAAYQFQFIGAPLRLLGQAVGKAVVIELAPVLTALVIAGRVGAGIAAELGTMRVTEQIDALDAMGIDPNRYLVMPRVIACVIMVPLLVLFANVIAIFGGLVVAVVGVDISGDTFLNGFRSSFQFTDFTNGMIKAVVFGLVIGIVGCYEGMKARGGAEGVGHATTTSVVLSSVMILVMNFVFAVLLFRL
ncbi:MAG: ABC transporter permease [candidate division Zixibacteria bacterium]|nr:ABC transporter permease [candidate division Zixibacteria bacterium]